MRGLHNKMESAKPGSVPLFDLLGLLVEKSVMVYDDSMERIIQPVRRDMALLFRTVICFIFIWAVSLYGGTAFF